MMKKWLAIGGLILVTVIWGGGFVASDMALGSMKPFQIMMVRFLLASVLMGMISMGQHKKEGKLENRAGAAHRHDDRFNRRRTRHITELVVVHDTLQIALIDIGRCLSLIRKVNKIDILTGNTGHHFWGAQTETIQNEGGFGSGLTLGNSLNIQTSLTIEISAGNCRYDTVTVRVLMT